MSAWLPGLLTGIHTYGYLAVWLIPFIAAVGVPLPVDLLLLAAGALSPGGSLQCPPAGALCREWPWRKP